MAWLKLHEGVPSHAKWPAVARMAKVKVAIVVAIWIALLDHASRNADRGSIQGFDPRIVDALYGLKDGICQRVAEALTKIGVLENDRIANWEKYQPETMPGGQIAPTTSKTTPQSRQTPKSNAERQQEYRQRKAERNADVTPCNGSVTARNAVTIENHSTSNEGVTENVTRRNENVTPCNASNGM